MPNYLAKGEQLISLKLQSEIKKAPEGFVFNWWRGQDLNLRPSGYEPGNAMLIRWYDWAVN